jgi:hypothetical protein
MKRSLKASGLLSALSLSLFGVSVVGCSAEGTPDSEALGTTSQAQGTFNPKIAGVNSSKDLQFMGEYKLTASKILVLGGYDTGGTAHTSAGIITNSANGVGSWTSLSSALPAALGEVEIVPLNSNSPVSKFLVVGGRSSRDGAAVTNTYILSLIGTSASWTTLSAANDLITGRVAGKNNVKKCGTTTSSKWIVLGGITNGGMASTTTTAATDSVEVFTYNSATPANSKWSNLILTGTTKPVKLAANGHGYHQTLSPSVTKFIVAGGATNTVATAVKTVEILEVNSSCEALTTSVVSTAVASPIINTSPRNMPSERARGASIQATGTLNLGGGNTFAYDFIIATGNDTTRFSATPPRAVFYYNSTADTWNGTFANLTTNGRVFGRLVQDETTATSVRMATGVVPDGTNTLFSSTPTAVDIISNAGVSAGTAMTNARVGSAVQLFGLNTAADYAALGTKYTAGSPPTAAAQFDVEDF